MRSPGRRLDLALIALHPGLSRRKARDVIEKGQVSVNGESVLAPGGPVSASAGIVWNPNKRALSRARLTLPLLYRNQTLLVVDKPPGLLSVPTSPEATDEDSAQARVLAYVQRLRPGNPYVGAVHRLDRDTSGALAFALTPAARTALRALFREHRIERRYAALVSGAPRSDTGLIDRPIRDAYVGGKRGVARRDEPSRPAATCYRVLERFPGAALLDVTLETGRQHQIRAHLAHIGHPILGDAVYGHAAAAPGRLRIGRQMLHAQWLGFLDPTTGQALRVESPLPSDFQQALRALRRLG